MSDRIAFLNGIREAAARGRAHRVSVNPEATHRAAYVGGGDDVVATFLNEWIAVGGRGQRVQGDDEARRFLSNFLDTCLAANPAANPVANPVANRVANVIRWQHPLLARLEIDCLLRARKINIHSWDELAAAPTDQRWHTAFAADLGITSADWAVAETGTLALCSHPGQGRVVSLLPPIYLAIIEPKQIVPDLFDLFERLEEQKQDLPSNVALVTGPSKTGDIELKLTTGVHGPGHVHVLVVE